MTVAAVILAASVESAVTDVEGVARVRRLADVAWAGGAVPVVVVAPDPTGVVAAALAGAPAIQSAAAPPEQGPVGQILRGFEAAISAVSETDAAIVWPARHQWVDAETITSLIEAHGQHPRMLLRPTFDGAAGWPVLVPRTDIARLRGVGPDRMPADIVDDLIAAGAVEWRLDLGDPGVTHDASVARADLPPFIGPSEPASGHHEWGSALGADANAGSPASGGAEALEGPALAPFGQANEIEDPAAEADAARLEP